MLSPPAPLASQPSAHLAVLLRDLVFFSEPLSEISHDTVLVVCAHLVLQGNRVLDHLLELDHDVVLECV